VPTIRSNFRCLLARVTLALSTLLLPQAFAQSPAIPDNPAGQTLAAFLDAFNTADHAKLAAYIHTYDSSETVDDLAGFHAETGNFTLLSIVDSTPSFISFRLKQASDGKEVYGTFSLSSTKPPKVKNWTVRLMQPGQTLDTTPLDAAARKRVIDAISARLTEFYIYPDMAKKMIATLNQHQQLGDYDRYTSGTEFAAALHDDLRDNHGGDPAMVQFIASYFFAESTHINDLYNRHDDETHQYWTQGYVPGPRIAAPLFVLTSNHTFSGAEEFTYDMQTQKRATIVGETTGGGAHPVDGMPAGDHFTIGVPLARPINPVTKKDWEGTGVIPEVKVPAADALTTAQKLAEEKLTPK
jgi:hypothetical protein